MRPSKDDYYLGIAESVSQRATCLRRVFGAIIVKDDVIVSTGYNGAARGVKDCLEWGECLKDKVGAPSGKGYDYCLAVHAEENAIINAARNGAEVLNGVMYIFGREYRSSEVVEAMPCERCRRAIINSGITQVITKRRDGSLVRYYVKDWIEEDASNYGKRLASYKKGGP